MKSGPTDRYCAPVGWLCNRFIHDLKVIKPGREYEVSVIPDETTTPGIGVLRIETDCPVPRHKIKQAFMVVLPNDRGPTQILEQSADPVARQPAWLAIIVISIAVLGGGGFCLLRRCNARAG